MEHHTYDVAIVGAGPVGIEMAVALKQAGLDVLHLEAKQVGQAMTWWAPQTQFFSTPERIAICGLPIMTTTQRRITGEHYLAYLRSVVEYFDLPIKLYEPVTHIEPGSPFTLHTAHRTGPRTYHADNVILATGGMAEPRRLNISGEDLPHVTHFYPGPHAYFRQRLLVVGGRNSAGEGALRSWRAGSDVAISYRRPELGSIKHVIKQELEHLIDIGKVGFYPATQPVEITPEHVVLVPTDSDHLPIHDAEPIYHPTDFVYLATGFQADMSLFRQAGVELQGAENKPLYDPLTMETNVPGLFALGTAAGGTQQKFEVFIETSHHQVVKIAEHLADFTPTIGSVPHRDYGFFPDEEELPAQPISHR